MPSAREQFPLGRSLRGSAIPAALIMRLLSRSSLRDGIMQWPGERPSQRHQAAVKTHFVSLCPVVSVAGALMKAMQVKS